jgi:NADH-quinone oxidoreductase subunit C
VIASEIHERVAKEFPGKITGFNGDAVDPYFDAERESVLEVCRYLRDGADLNFEVLSDLTALDLPKENKIQVVYHLYSYAQRHQIVLKVDTPREEPRIASVEEVWKVANWLEREVFDLFGVIFEGHSDLRRIMLPEDWTGHPLRKDYVEQEEYDGISTQREALVHEVLREARARRCPEIQGARGTKRAGVLDSTSSTFSERNAVDSGKCAFAAVEW